MSIKSAIAYVESINPKTMRERVARDQALATLRAFAVADAADGITEGDAATIEAYGRFRNLEEVLAAVESGTLSAETALMLERAGKNRVTYVAALEGLLEVDDG